MKTCKYCGQKLSDYEVRTRNLACGNCGRKLPLVRQIIAIGEQIKAAAAKGATLPGPEDYQKYKQFYDRITALPDCNTCSGKRSCPYCPAWGEPVRINCPLYEE